MVKILTYVCKSNHFPDKRNEFIFFLYYKLNNVASFLKKPNFDGYTRSAEIKDGKIVLTTETDYNKLDFETYRGRIHLSGSATLENERKLSNVENNLKKEGFSEKK